jgi:hypothetical protein
MVFHFKTKNKEAVEKVYDQGRMINVYSLKRETIIHIWKRKAIKAREHF